MENLIAALPEERTTKDINISALFDAVDEAVTPRTRKIFPK
jgi:hypothetical protein